MRLSVLMPVYEEEASIAEITRQVLRSPLVSELIIVDDGSRDGTPALLGELARTEPRVRLVVHPENRGKGAAIRSGIAYAREPFVIIQDADLEYDPAEYPRIVAPLVAGEADVVFGSRYHREADRRGQTFAAAFANRTITGLSNLCTGLELTDVETCYKCFRRELLAGLVLSQDRFGIEVELVDELARCAARVAEVGITYRGRGRHEGKKIGVADGLEALWLILRLRFGRARRAGQAVAAASETAP